MKRLIKSLIKTILLLPVFLMATGTDYYITIDNKTPWDLKYVSHYFSRGSFDSNEFDKTVAANSKSQQIRINAKSGKGGEDTRVSGSITYQSVEFSKYQATGTFNMDRHADRDVYSFYSSSNSDDNLLDVSDKIDDKDDPEELTIVVKLKTNFFPYKFISLGLGKLDVTACGQHAAQIGGGYYRNPCKNTENVDNYLSIGFANSPDLCRITLDSGMQIKEGSLACNMGTAARYIKDKSAIVFVCQSKGFGTSACPWVKGKVDHLNFVFESIY